MIIYIEYYKGDKLLVGKALSFQEIRCAVREIFETQNEDGFVAAFCARYGYRELPFSEGHFDYLIDLDREITHVLQSGAIRFVKQHDMTPRAYIDQLHSIEKCIFAGLYAGKLSQKLYRLYEFEK